MKPNKTEIADKLTRWAKLEKKRLAIEAKRDEELDPHVARFQKATEAINSNANLKLVQVNDELTAVAKEIETAMMLGVDAKSGLIALPQVSVTVGKATALAEVALKEGPRVIDAKQFFDHTPPAKRTGEFWASVTIGIARAKEFFGEVLVNKMASKPKAPKFELKLSE